MDPNLYKAAMLSNIEVLGQHKYQLGVQFTANNSTVLHVAAQFHDNIECVQAILDLQPSLLCQVNSKRETALHVAARNGHSNTVRELIEHTKSLEEDPESRVQINKEMIWMTNEHGDTALHEAARNKHLDVVEMLVREDAEFPHVVNNFGETPLYIAAKKDYHEIVSTILEACKSPAHSGPDGKTALHAAVIAGCPECTEKILGKKPNLMKEAGLDGWTPLHYAAREGHINIMKELLSHSPDCWEIVNGKGQNILHIANENGKEEVINFIRSQSMENKGNTPFNLPLSRDVQNSWLSNLENQMDNDGNTPFNLSATSNKDLTSIIKGNKPEEDEIKDEPENADADHQLDGIPETEMKESEAENTKMREDFKNILNTDLVVAALVATVTFTAGLTLPGGFHSNEGPDEGRALLVRVAAFKAFVITNALAMGFSFTAITVYVMSPLSKKRKELEKQLATGVSLIQYAMTAMLIAFMTGSYAVLANSLDLAVGVIIIGSSFYLAASVFHEKCLKDAYATFYELLLRPKSKNKNDVT